MRKRERRSISENLSDIQAKHLPVLMAVLTGILFALTMLVLVFVKAVDIRGVMEKDLPKIFEEMREEIDAVEAMEDGSEESIRSAYQLVMASYDDVLSSEYPFLSASYIMNRGGNVVMQSRNMMIVSLSKDGEEWMNIPMAFRRENTSEVAALIWPGMAALSTQLTVNPNATHARTDWAVISGYWSEGLFWVQTIEKPDFTYESNLEVPGNNQLVTYIANGVIGSDWRYLKTVNISKNFGKTDYHSANFVRGWGKADRLIEYRIPMYWDTPVGWVQEGNLFSMKSYGVMRITDVHDVFTGENRMQLVYCTEYSPMALAFGYYISTGLFWVLLGVYVVFGVALATLVIHLRKKEVSVLEDQIQQQKQALDYARDAENSRRQMTSAIAHELKTPIAVLSSYSEALQENIDAEKQKYYLEVIREETDRMDRMVLELLDLSRLEAGKYKLRRENFDLEELVREIIRPLESQIDEKKITVEWQIGEKETLADRYRFGQVVENFLTNAIRHTPQGGRIILRIGMNHETLSVENTGRPIPQDQLGKVWETFWQGDRSRNERGSGLGLAICRSIMFLHGGSCKVENTASGVRFTANIDKSKATTLTARPKERIVELEYPIAQEYTTLDRVFIRLRLLDMNSLRREVKAGNVQCNGKNVENVTERVYPGQILRWEDFRITVTMDNDLKHKAILQNQFGATGRLSNFAPHVGATGGSGGA